MLQENAPVRYRLADGRAVLSVTQILKAAGYIDDAWFTEDAADRGTRLHTAMERCDKRQGAVFEPDIIGRIEAHHKFTAECKPVYEGIEVEIVDPILQIGGRIDRICAALFGKRAILDFKSGAVQKWHGAQTWAYWYLDGGRIDTQRFGCYLRDDGSYRLKPYTSAEDGDRFLDAYRKAHRT
jgi:RecB family exonuclease